MKSSHAESASARAGPRRGRPRGGAVDSPPRTRSSPARSPARTRRASLPAASSNAAPRSRSPGRRSPVRRSSARKPAPKFPARKSPARTTETRKSPARRTVVSDEPFHLKPKLSEPSVRLAQTRRSEYSIKDLSVELSQVEMSVGDRVNGLTTPRDHVLAPQKVEIVRRTSARLRDSGLRQRDSSSRPSESASRSLDLPLDNVSDEEPTREKSASTVRKLATPLRGFSIGKLATAGHRWEFGGRIGSWLLILAFPTWVLTVVKQCAVLPQVVAARELVSGRACALVTGQVVLQTLLASLKLFGRTVHRMDESGQQQYFNGLFAGFLTLNGLFILDFFHILSIKSLLEEYLRLAVLFYILAALLAVCLFLKSRKLGDDELNTYGNTGCTLYDFFMGRELFPQLGQLDVKILLHRICNLNGLILSVLIFVHGLSLPEVETSDIRNYKDALSQLRYDPTLLVFSSMQLIYFLNWIFNEYKITSTFSWQSEGVGYLQTVSSALYPFYFVSISKFVLDKKITLPNGVLVAASVLYLIGFVIYFISNNTKYEFRKNPLQPKLAHLDVMPTFLGKRLMISGLWGTVRHPNYLGDIIVHIALAIPGAYSGPSLALLPAVTAILILVHRATRDNARCRRRYGAAWQRYTMKVPSAIIPKIY